MYGVSVVAMHFVFHSVKDDTSLTPHSYLSLLFWYCRYDVYLTKEPNVYEAMALVHSRVRRVVFGMQDEEMGGLGGVTSNAASRQNGGIHSLPGTNHHYRAFRLDVDNAGGQGEEVKAIATSLQDIHKV